MRQRVKGAVHPGKAVAAAYRVGVAIETERSCDLQLLGYSDLILEVEANRVDCDWNLRLGGEALLNEAASVVSQVAVIEVGIAEKFRPSARQHTSPEVRDVVAAEVYTELEGVLPMSVGDVIHDHVLGYIAPLGIVVVGTSNVCEAQTIKIQNCGRERG